MTKADRLTTIRRQIGCSKIYAEAYTRGHCEVIYGRPVSDRTWARWCQKVRAEADPVELGGFSEASYVLLHTLAVLLAGNNQSRRCQAPLTRLCHAAEAAIRGEKPWDIPERISYADLKRLAELQALRSYCDRRHRYKGLYKSKPFYSKAEAVQILNNYPNFSNVERNQKRAG